ncbi:MAG TPA: S8 family peptidase, partial [Caldilineaceae bacterium]|nr:S8 family peptidase [Caldilineaceae bacterium]
MQTDRFHKLPKEALRSFTLLVSTLLLIGCSMRPIADHTAQVELQAVPLRETVVAAPKLQPYLNELAHSDPTDLVRVIVQHDGQSSPLQDTVAATSGVVVNELAFIDALVVDIAAGDLITLAADERVNWISLDAPVRSASATDGSAANVRDDFDQVAYDGSSGALTWTDNWQEIGEADGPGAGNVAVTTFWGGALQGLRLQGKGTGAVRAFDLYDAESARVGISFRRKDFQAEDAVTIEFSDDGGVSWQTVARLGGPTTDAEMQYADYALPTGDATQVQLRFVTAATMSENAKFYLDAIDIRLQRPAAALSHQIYLPFVAGAEQAPAENAATATRSKDDVTASWSSYGESCNYHCFSLDDLNSTYIKAIGADKLWNVAPYPRGWQVGVAVVDSGISPHPDLNDYYNSGRLVKQINFVPGNPTPDDFYGHGTHVAGIIGGIGQSSDGAYMGVAPEAKLIDVRVTDDYGMGNTSTVVAGLEWIYQNRNTYNIKIANLSLNSTLPESYHQSPLNAAVEILWFNKIVVVVSAGNGGQEKLYPPANDPFVITVGSVDDKKTADISDDKLSSFSAYGITVDGFAKPDIVAPGQNIVSLLAGDDMNLKKSFPANAVSGYQNKYFRMSGTSMASAVVAGAVAILLESDSGLTPDQVKYRLMATAKPFTVNNATCATGAGYLDLYAAVHSNTTASANNGLTASQMLWTGSNPVTWSSVSWNSVSWNSVSWNSVSWNSVSWNSVSWNSV